LFGEETDGIIGPLDAAGRQSDFGAAVVDLDDLASRVVRIFGLELLESVSLFPKY
jgi:hypothetical protein